MKPSVEIAIMKRLQLTLLLTLITALFFCACDARRNEILSHILVSPTMTETPVPPTETPTITPTLAPTLTPTPYIAVENMDLLMFGDYDLADYTIKSRIKNSKDVNETLKAQTDSLELAYLRENYSQCAEIMAEINETLSTTRERPSEVLAKANYINAQCAENIGDSKSEIESLDRYIAYRPESPLLASVYSQTAYAYHTLGDYENFRKNIERSVSYDEEFNNDYVKLDVAVSYSSQGNHDEAVVQLMDLYISSTDENIKAAADYYLGTAYEALGRRDQTIARYQDGVNSFPRSYYSYLMLLWLLENGQTVSDYQRGLINYYVGQYALANEAFRRYVKNEPGNDGSSWYFIGICQMNTGDYEGAVTSFRRIINDYPDNRYYVSAWDELAYVQWTYQEKYKQAAQTLTDYVSRHPDKTDAASFLYEAGRILERGNYLKDAAKTWARLIDEYPLYENSKSALFFAAIASYRTADYETALAYLNRMLLVSGIPDDQAQANFWIAKVYQKRGDAHNKQQYLEKAAEISNSGYYSLRAKELLEGKAYLSHQPSHELNIDLENEKQVADQWMMLTFGLDESQLRDRSVYQDDKDYRAAQEYYKLGEYYQASMSFERVQEKLMEHPAASYAFLEEMVEKKIYNAAAYTARQILTAAGLYEDDRTLDVPNYFSHIRFGAWYKDYVEEVSKLYDISPFILYAVMKQESMFNPWISSSAGARGLMQIMPETGAETAKTLHWPPNYSEADLFRVPISVNFGASYLRRVYNYFDQNGAAMLAAYNGGSGNTQKWLSLANNDPDLLFEVIRFQETRNYVKNIYRNTKIYEWLYAK